MKILPPPSGRAKSVQLVDYNNDGRISRSEFRKALRAAGHHHLDAYFKTREAMKNHAVDVNGDGYISAEEVQRLAKYARDHWGIAFSTLEITPKY